MFLSQRGDTSRPISFSRSPWLKNSSMHLAVHSRCRAQHLVGWDTSALCRTMHITFVLSMLEVEWKLSKNINCENPNICHLSIPFCIWHFICFKLPKCIDMSKFQEVECNRKLLRANVRYYLFLGPSLLARISTFETQTLKGCSKYCSRCPS